MTPCSPRTAIALRTRVDRWLERAPPTRVPAYRNGASDGKLLGTKKPLSAQIANKRTQFANIELSARGRESPLICRDSAGVREILVHD